MGDYGGETISNYTAYFDEIYKRAYNTEIEEWKCCNDNQVKEHFACDLLVQASLLRLWLNIR